MFARISNNIPSIIIDNHPTENVKSKNSKQNIFLEIAKQICEKY